MKKITIITMTTLTLHEFNVYTMPKKEENKYYNTNHTEFIKKNDIEQDIRISLKSITSIISTLKTIQNKIESENHGQAFTRSSFKTMPKREKEKTVEDILLKHEAMMKREKEKEAMLKREKEKEAILKREKEKEAMLKREKEKEAMLKKEKEKMLNREREERETTLKKDKIKHTNTFLEHIENEVKLVEEKGALRLKKAIERQNEALSFVLRNAEKQRQKEVNLVRKTLCLEIEKLREMNYELSNECQRYEKLHSYDIEKCNILQQKLNTYMKITNAINGKNVNLQTLTTINAYSGYIKHMDYKEAHETMLETYEKSQIFSSLLPAKNMEAINKYVKDTRGCSDHIIQTYSERRPDILHKNEFNSLVKEIDCMINIAKSNSINDLMKINYNI